MERTTMAGEGGIFGFLSGGDEASILGPKFLSCSPSIIGSGEREARRFSVSDGEGDLPTF